MLTRENEKKKMKEWQVLAVSIITKYLFEGEQDRECDLDRRLDFSLEREDEICPRFSSRSRS